MLAVVALVLRRLVVQILTEPSLYFAYLHALAFTVIDNLITLNFAEGKITRLRMGEVKTAYTRSGPHSEGFGDLNPCIRFDVEQTPQCSFLSVVGAGRISCRGANPAIFFLN